MQVRAKNIGECEGLNQKVKKGTYNYYGSKNSENSCWFGV